MNQNKKTNLILFIIVLIGFLFRIHNLGHFSLWNDEAGQALAASQPTLNGLLDISRSHIMAMPLDYFVSKLFFNFSKEEGFIRLPSVIWSTFSLYYCFLICKLYLNNKTSLLATWFLAINPLIIFYSQEMRFYAALGFFSLLTTYLLMVCIKNNKISSWILLTIFSIIGAFFHPYTILTGLIGLTFIIYNILKHTNINNVIVRFTISYVVIILVFYIGILVYNPTTSSNTEFLQFNNSIIEIIAKGLGFHLVQFCNKVNLFGFWEIFGILFSILGILNLPKLSKGKPILLSLFISIGLQIISIIILDLVRNYWFVYRQLIHLIPFICILMSIGLVSIFDRYKLKLVKNIQTQRIINTISIILISIFALPRIFYYYDVEKGNGKEISNQIILQSSHELTNKVLIIPGYESKIYDYYINYYFIQNNLSINLNSIKKWSDIENINTTDLYKLFIITPSNISENQRLLLEDKKNFQTTFSENICNGSRDLWIKK